MLRLSVGSGLRGARLLLLQLRQGQHAARGAAVHAQTSWVEARSQRQQLPTLRGVRCLASSADASSSGASPAAGGKKKVVFCGTPEVGLQRQASGSGNKKGRSRTSKGLAVFGQRPGPVYSKAPHQPSGRCLLQVAALVLERLLEAAAQPDASFEVRALQ